MIVTRSISGWGQLRHFARARQVVQRPSPAADLEGVTGACKQQGSSGEPVEAPTIPPSKLHESRACDRRPTQAEGVHWFTRLLSQVAPEFEVYELPKQSRFPVLIRRRAAENTSALEGVWSLIQIRATVSSRRFDAASGDKSVFSRTAWHYVRNESSTVNPKVPCVVFSPFANACFVSEAPNNRPWLRARPGGKNEIDLTTNANELGSWLRRVFPVTPTSSISGTLVELLRLTATTPAIRKQRMFVTQLLRIPIFQSIVFRSRGIGGSTGYNALLDERRLLVRAPERISSLSDTRLRMRFSLVPKGSHPVAVSGAELDYYLAMTMARNGEEETLAGIGIIPRAAVTRGRLYRRDPTGKLGTYMKVQPILSLDDANNVGGDFTGLQEFFFFFDGMTQETINEKCSAFANDIFNRWDPISEEHDG
ncbi:unnamed protein product [Amoebophrya sp. A25]|nr:unnamed protein product [Amoebophrya sp. A25]|eukprot:GSA25T00021415001.1